MVAAGATATHDPFGGRAEDEQLWTRHVPAGWENHPLSPGLAHNPLIAPADSVERYDRFASDHIEAFGFVVDRTETLDPSELTANQPEVQVAVVEQLRDAAQSRRIAGRDDAIMVVDDGEHLWIWDGNHRAVAALLEGRTVTCHIMDAGDLYDG